MKQPVKRRLAAILAADVAGYSRLMGLDEAGTAQALRDRRAAADPLIADHGGRIVKTTGDGVLIEFGSAKIEPSLAALPTPNWEDDDHAVLFDGRLYTASPERDEGEPQYQPPGGS